LNKKVRISCNMRFGVLNYNDYVLMRKAGFRLLLFGLESANQETLDYLDKGIKVEDDVSGAGVIYQALEADMVANLKQRNHQTGRSVVRRR